VNAGSGTQQNPPAVGAGSHPTISGSGWDPSWNGNLAPDTATLVANLKCSTQYETWTDAADGNESLAINCIDWFQPMAFCAWDGGLGRDFVRQPVQRVRGSDDCDVEPNVARRIFRDWCAGRARSQSRYGRRSRHPRAGRSLREDTVERGHRRAAPHIPGAYCGF